MYIGVHVACFDDIRFAIVDNLDQTCWMNTTCMLIALTNDARTALYR
jgi:hypothetical protein